LEARYRPEIDDLIGLGLLERQDGRLRLAASAYLIANQVFTRFVG
jgi:coproporphyrinogen III oxidase-like Fe-S oxidoreductase